MTINIFCLVYAKLKLRLISVIPYRRVHLSFASGSRASGGGRLALGKQWPGSQYYPSQLVMRKNAELIVNGRFTIYSGHNITINEGAVLVLGSGYINNDLDLACFDRIEIGDDVAISKSVTIRDSDNHIFNGRKHSKPVKIGNHVWIGLNVIILKGVTIGDGAVVAAGALVNKDVPPRSLVGGVPAVILRSDVEWV
jgi:acetyltransferase-like isoleucine patch superfamily enzyme